MGYNEAIEWIGGPEAVTAGVLVKMSGHMSGIMLSVQPLEFVNIVLRSMFGTNVTSYEEMGELGQSALVEIGNIMISTFINALSGLADRCGPDGARLHGGHAGRDPGGPDGRIWWDV